MGVDILGGGNSIGSRLLSRRRKAALGSGERSPCLGVLTLLTTRSTFGPVSNLTPMTWDRSSCQSATGPYSTADMARSTLSPSRSRLGSPSPTSSGNGANDGQLEDCRAVRAATENSTWRGGCVL
jgi:hypothetical protein